jgi:hypothetical protein
MKHFSKILLAEDYNEEHFERSLLYLCYDDKGPYLLEDVYTPGWAASNYGGGAVRIDLPRNFYRGQTPDTFAERLSMRFREQVRNNQELAAFLEEANRRG